MIYINKELMKKGKMWPNGQVITDIGSHHVFTTAQLEQGKIYAATYAYLIVGENVAGTKIRLKKHPNIKGSKAR